MELSQEQRSQIEDIISRTLCPRKYECYRSDFEKLCKIKVVGTTGLIECSKQNRRLCRFGVPFGYKTFCNCQLRHYISPTFGI
jgi:hypothetical protein